MKTGGLVLGTFVAVLLAALSPAAGAPRCPTVRHPLARGDQSVLFVRRANVVGCWRPLGRVRLVARAGVGFRRSDVEHAVVAGHYGAVALRTHGGITDQLFVYAANLRTGVVHTAEANFLDVPTIATPTAADVAALALARDGSLAWTSNGGGAPTGQYHVEAMDRHGRNWIVDDEPGIAPKSLRLKGLVLSWSVAGQRRTARLP